MPEAAIHKDGNPKFRENEIWFTEYRLMTPPTYNVVLPENPNQCQLCIFVSTPPDSRHDVASLFCAKNVRHHASWFYDCGSGYLFLNCGNNFNQATKQVEA